MRRPLPSGGKSSGGCTDFEPADPWVARALPPGDGAFRPGSSLAVCQTRFATGRDSAHGGPEGRPVLSPPSMSMSSDRDDHPPSAGHGLRQHQEQNPDVRLAGDASSLPGPPLSDAENKRSLTAKASGALSSASTQTARELDLWIKERRYDLRVFASSYEVTENLERLPRTGSRASPRLAGYLNSVRDRFPDYSELLILDARGRIVASTGEQAQAVQLPADWQARMRADAFVVGGPTGTRS